MRRTLILSVVAIALCLSGCQNHQAKIGELKKEHERLSDQFRADCTAEFLKIPPTLSAKCADEQKKMNDAWQRLQAEQAKQ